MRNIFVSGLYMGEIFEKLSHIWIILVKVQFADVSQGEKIFIFIFRPDNVLPFLPPPEGQGKMKSDFKSFLKFII